jgi:KamA family protein
MLKPLTENVYQSYALHNYKKIEQIKILTSNQIEAIEVVGRVLPFKTNNYVVEQLIDWDNIPNDPMFILNFPQKDMLLPHHYKKMKDAIDREASKNEIKQIAHEIRLELNPHPAGQKKNIPSLDDIDLTGIQHKYRETALIFPSQGQTCHAYCSFCFRWPQFVGMEDQKFAMKEIDLMVAYLKEHKEITDVLFTGGDPMVMKARILNTYIEPLLSDDLKHIQTIRIGTKSLSYWPYKFLTDDDSAETIDLFNRINESGRNLSIMAHFNHPVELETDAVKEAIKVIRATGAQIRTQSPLLKNINDHADLWADMWRKQVNLNCIPYYMFVVRDTGAQHYFGIPLVKAHELFQQAYQSVSGICRTVRGPSMSTGPGKIQILGVSEINGEKLLCMRMIQGRNPDWVAKPFFAKYDEKAIWLDELEPAFGEPEFFFEQEMKELLMPKKDDSGILLPDFLLED